MSKRFLNLLILFLLLLLSAFTTSELTRESIRLYINKENNPNSIIKIGQEGTFGLITNIPSKSIFNYSDIEEETKFLAEFYDRNGELYNFECRLWAPESMNIVQLCESNMNLTNSTLIVYELATLSFGDYDFYIRFYNFELEVQLLDYNIPFIYSDIQYINLDEQKESYELKFKYDLYKDQKLALTESEEKASYTDFDICYKNESELICEVAKKKIEGILASNTTLSLALFDGQYGIINYDFVLDIKVLTNEPKEEISLEIIEALNSDSETGSLVFFKTNISNIPPLTTNKFDLEVITYGQFDYITCILKKYDNGETPLLLMCENKDRDYDFLIEKDILLENINYKYDFKIIYNDFFQRISVKPDSGKKIIFNYPLILDLTKSDKYTIQFFLENSQNFNDIKFSKDSAPLECTTDNYIKTCTVNKTHFDGIQTGYYFPYYSNKYLNDTIAYDAQPIKVIIEPNVLINVKLEDNKDIIIGEMDPDTRILATIPFITDFDDSKQNVFNISDIEEKTQFKMRLIDEYGYEEYKVNCRLWKPKNEKLRLFCGINYLNREKEKISFNRVSFQYNEYTIIIKAEGYFEIKQCRSTFSFLYSDEQIINLDEDEEYYNLKFKYDLYNTNDDLYIFSGSNYIPVNNCEREEKELSCKINKNILEENLIKPEKFKLGTLNEYCGAITLNSVLGININYNETKEKQNISVTISFPVENTTKAGQSFIYRTHSSPIDNIITDKFPMKFLYKQNYTYYNCYLKKNDGIINYLALLCSIPQEGEYLMDVQKLELTDIHYKYNFIINKLSDDIYINVKDRGTQIYYTYPYNSNLTLSESVTLRYIMDDPTLSGNILIKHDNESAGTLNCRNSGILKTCKVPISFFDGKKDGYYYTYQQPNSLYYDSTPFYFTLPPNNLIIMRIQESGNYGVNVGLNGLLYFVTNYKDNTKNIFNDTHLEDNFSFDASFKDEKDNLYEMTCRFWNPKNDYMRIFCKLKEELISSSYITLNEVSFYYKDYNIMIIPECNPYVTKYNYDYPFIYSEKQIIVLEEGKDVYELRFKVLYFYEQSFAYLSGYSDFIPLEDCEIIRKELFCSIRKDIILENIIDLNNKLTFYNFHNSFGNIKLDSVLGIYINSTEPIIKENVYIKIIRLINDVNEYPGYIVYETNISSISNLITGKLYGKYFKDNTTELSGYCHFRKNSQNNLLFLCNLINKGENIHLIEITSPKTFNNIHYKYNFIISPVTNDEKFTYAYGPFGSNVIRVFPKTIDLRYKDHINVIYYFELSNNVKNITLHPDLPNLKCQETLSFYNCTVPLYYFKEYNSTYYYTYHKNHKDMLTIYYEAPPFEVLFPYENKTIIRIKKEDNQNDILVSRFGYVYLVTDYDDSELHIFKDEAEYSFKTYIVENDIINYDTTCTLWKPKNSKIRLFCTVIEGMPDGIQYIKLNLSEFTYNNHKIVIYSQDKIKINIIQKLISFYYSSPQIIYLDDNITEYEFKFKYKSYMSADKLYLGGEMYNIALFDHCGSGNKELVCTLTKDKIEELLTRNKEAFKLGIFNEKYGIYYFDNVLEIKMTSNNTNKENIYINQIKLLNNVSEVGSVYAYKTNIKSISNFNTIEYQNCRLYKNSFNPLLILCTPKSEGDKSFGNITTPIELYDIHYKYNIIIEPLENMDIINVVGKGTQIKMIYPQILNLTVKEYVEIYYIMDSPEIAQNIKLNLDSEDLECEDLDGTKKCIVPLTHFIGKETGYYYTYHSNHLNGSSIFYNAPPVYVILPPDDLIVLRIKLEDNKNKINVGLNGTLYFVTNYDDSEANIFDASDIEERTYFETSVRDQQGFHFDVKCRLWKPTSGNIRLFCDLQKNLRNTEQRITVDDASFKYDNYTIYISSNEDINVTQFNTEIPFIFSDKQEINIEETIESYIFKFRTYKYNNELLYINNRLSYITIDSCKKDNKDLTCEIPKLQLEENLVLYNNTGNFKLVYLDDNNGSVSLYSVDDIIIKNTQQEKEDIYISITKLLNEVSEIGVVIGYETNITNIDNLKTSLFAISFYDLLYDKYVNGYCYFKKHNGDNTILFLCNVIGEGYFFALETEDDIILNNIHYKYNFILSPIETSDVIKIADFGTEIQLTYPTLLNFTIEESLTIKYIMPLPFLAYNIKLNPDNSPLDCNYVTGFLKCNVPVNHFNGKENGYYYTYHLNHLNEYSIYYDSTPFQVILPNKNTIVIRIKNENNNLVTVGSKGTLYFETNYNDSIKNIFNSSDIETMTKYETSAIDQEGNIYNNIICRLWKPQDKNLRLFCNIEEDFKYEKQYIKLNQATFKYNDYTIVVRFEDDILVKQLNYLIPFLYGDKQEINIEEETDTYKLIFNFDLLTNDILTLNCNDTKCGYIVLDTDNIEIKGKKLIFTLDKNKLEEVIYNGNKYILNAINDNYGLLSFSEVFGIDINYNFSKKRNIYVNINDLLVDYTQINTFIAYETKYNGRIPNLVSNMFELPFIFNKNVTINANCYFKKTDGQDLLLLCKFDYEGEWVLEKITNDIVIDYIHNKYNFIILPEENNQIIQVYDSFGTNVQLNYPYILNFTLSDTLTIRYIMSNTSNAENIKLNPDSTDLECTDISSIKTCIVPLSHFDGKKSGYYFTYHLIPDHNISTIYYDSTPIKVILPLA